MAARSFVANYRTNNVSIARSAPALARDPHAEVARISVTRPDGLPGRPKGTAVTSDGRYAVGFRPGRVSLPLLRERDGVDHRPALARVVATVIGVGNDPYGLTLVEGDED